MIGTWSIGTSFFDSQGTTLRAVVGVARPYLTDTADEGDWSVEGGRYPPCCSVTHFISYHTCRCLNPVELLSKLY